MRHRTVAIVSARRTPHGRFLGGLSHLTAVELGACAASAAAEGVGPIDQLIMGQVILAGSANNPARQVAQRTGLQSTPAYTVQMACGAGMQAIILGFEAIRSGRAQCVLVGAQESMSQAPHLAMGLRRPQRKGDLHLLDSLTHDGLTDPNLRQRMGDVVESRPELARFPRGALDAWALRSQQRADRAFREGCLDAELVPLAGLADDEPRRPDSTLEQLAELPAAFGNKVTAGNLGKLADGATALVLCDGVEAARRGLPVLAIMEDWASAANAAEDAALTHCQPIRRLCDRLARGVGSCDWIEINEAFAVRVLCVLDELGLSVDDCRVNPDGGAIALGHPVAVSPARLVCHLAHAIHAGRARRGLAAVSVTGDMGLAVSLLDRA